MVHVQKEGVSADLRTAESVTKKLGDGDLHSQLDVDRGGEEKCTLAIQPPDTCTLRT